MKAIEILFLRPRLLARSLMILTALTAFGMPLGGCRFDNCFLTPSDNCCMGATSRPGNWCFRYRNADGHIVDVVFTFTDEQHTDFGWAYAIRDCKMPILCTWYLGAADGPCPPDIVTRSKEASASTTGSGMGRKSS